MDINTNINFFSAVIIMKAIILISLLFVLILFVLYFQQNYEFKELFDICYKNDTINQIIAEQNIFYNKTNSDSIDIDNINCDKLCITDSNNKMECITKEELFTIIKLPAFRKYNICVNGACITNNEIKILNGKSPILIQSNSKLDNDGKCINVKNKAGKKNGTEDPNERQFVDLKDCNTVFFEIIKDPLSNQSGNMKGYVLYFKDDARGFDSSNVKAKATEFKIIEKDDSYILKITKDDILGERNIYLYFEEAKGFHYTSTESKAIEFKFLPRDGGFIIEIVRDPQDPSNTGEMMYYNHEIGFSKTTKINEATKKLTVETTAS